MEREKLRTTLAAHLDTLQRNLAVVPLEILKTKYQKPYRALVNDICTAASAYTREIALSDIRIKQKYFDEARGYIDAAITQSTKLKEISRAAFRRQDIKEIERLALELHREIVGALQPFYSRHIGLYITSECLENPDKTPEHYNDATGCVWRDGMWKPLDDTNIGLLLFVKEKSKTQIPNAKTIKLTAPVMAQKGL